jgi:hypothetical protein
MLKHQIKGAVTAVDKNIHVFHPLTTQTWRDMYSPLEEPIEGMALKTAERVFVTTRLVVVIHMNESSGID